MESLMKKRKGEILARADSLTVTRPADIGSYSSLKHCSAKRKKGKVHLQADRTSSCNSIRASIATSSPCRKPASNSPGRGHKRKIGCIDSRTQTGRRNKLNDEYVLGRELGQGKFGSVRVCRCNASGNEFACKTLKKNGGESAHREVEIMQHLSGHPSVVNLHAVYEDPDVFHLVMEFCCGGRLLDQMATVGKYSEQRAATIVKEIILAIKYCHEMGVVHRDIKPENILLTSSGKLKLADFGLASRLSEGHSLSGVVGSPSYVAPEVLQGNYSEKVDTWAAGVLLHGLLVGFLPFRGPDLEAIFYSIKTAQPKFEGKAWDSVSRPARDLVGRMLMKDPSKRITVSEILSHPWLTYDTGSSMTSLTVNPKTRILGGRSCQTHIKRVDLGKFPEPSQQQFVNVFIGFQTTQPHTALEGEMDESALVDALVMAISHVRISKPKSSRPCAPVDSTWQECPSNLKPNMLCAAF